jgi:hypothetical protein
VMRQHLSQRCVCQVNGPKQAAEHCKRRDVQVRSFPAPLIQDLINMVMRSLMHPLKDIPPVSIILARYLLES